MQDATVLVVAQIGGVTGVDVAGILVGRWSKVPGVESIVALARDAISPDELSAGGFAELWSSAISQSEVIDEEEIR